jgi:hypothetical protein
MARPNFQTFLLPILLMLNVGRVFAVGQSAVITLVFPSGSRSMAMGEVGTALADDEQVLFYNPAGLGIKNDRWRGGAVTEFYEQLLPAFKISDLWHLHVAGAYQPWYMMDIGGFAMDWNFINFGTNDLTDGQGRTIGKTKSYEYVYTSGCGFNLEKIGIKNHAFGISTKYIYSALAPGSGPNGEGVSQSYAFDFGYLWQLLPYIRFGFTFANMGPAVSYVSQDQKDPIPFTINTAVAYKDNFSINKIKVFELAAELRSNIEVVKNYPDKDPDPFWKAIYTGLLHDTSKTIMDKFHEINWHAGFDATFLNTVSVRQGYLFDKSGQRYETHWGLGLQLFNHFQWDIYGIISPEGYMKGVFASEGSSGARDGQWGISFTFFRIVSWSEMDRVWWKK